MPEEIVKKRGRGRPKKSEADPIPTPAPGTVSEPMRLRPSGSHFSKARRKFLQKMFIEQYLESGNIVASYRRIGVTNALISYWKKHDKEFLTLFEEAEEQINNVIEEEIKRRAIDGVNKPIVYKGQIQGAWMLGEEIVPADTPGAIFRPATIKEYSDTLLIFMAKARMPKYKDKETITPESLRAEAEKLASKYGLDAQTLIDEAEKIVKNA